MTKTTKILAVLLTFLALPAVAAAATWNVDTVHSGVNFSVRHFFTQVPGGFSDFSGTIDFDADKGQLAVDFTVQVASVDTQNEDRDKHLRSPDFFDAEKFPTMTFKSTAAKHVDGGNWELVGDLTIHGVTKKVTVPVEFLGAGETPMGTKAGFHAEFTIDRKEFGISWNRALDQGGAVLGDDVKIEIAVEANLEKAAE